MIKKIIASIIILIIVISINTGVLAMSTAVRTSTMTTMMMITSASRGYRNTYTIDKAIEEIYNETQCKELKTYITENKQYLYLDNKSKAEAIINKYKESNLEETKQFIESNYYDKDKPEKDKAIGVILTIILAIVVIFGITVMILIVDI